MSGTKITYVTEVPPPPQEVIIVPTAPPAEPAKPPNPTIKVTTRTSYFKQRNRQMCVQNAGILDIFFTDWIDSIKIDPLFSFLSAYLWRNGPGRQLGLEPVLWPPGNERVLLQLVHRIHHWSLGLIRNYDVHPKGGLLRK